MKLNKQKGHADYSCLLWVAAAVVLIAALVGAGGVCLVIEIFGRLVK